MEYLDKIASFIDKINNLKKREKDLQNHVFTFLSIILPLFCVFIKICEVHNLTGLEIMVGGITILSLCDIVYLFLQKYENSVYSIVLKKILYCFGVFIIFLYIKLYNYGKMQLLIIAISCLYLLFKIQTIKNGIEWLYSTFYMPLYEANKAKINL